MVLPATRLFSEILTAHSLGQARRRRQYVPRGSGGEQIRGAEQVHAKYVLRPWAHQAKMMDSNNSNTSLRSSFRLCHAPLTLRVH